MSIITTNDQYYKDIANAIRNKALLHTDEYKFADEYLHLGWDENYQPITKIPPSKMALAINTYWKDGTHLVFNGASAFSNKSSWNYKPAVDLDGIEYTPENSKLIDLSAPNNGTSYEYYFYIKPDDTHCDYSINVYSIYFSTYQSRFWLYTNILKGAPGAPTTEWLSANTSQVKIEAGNNTEANSGHYIRITVPFSLSYKNYNYDVTGDKTISIYRPTILDRFYAYLA